MSSQIARLTTVAHVLYDREVLELRQENERLREENNALKLERFWKEYNLPKLGRAITHERIRYRFQTIERAFNPNIDWHFWMGPLIQSYGLEIEIVEDFHTPPSNANVHFSCTRLYHITSYGAKLLKAKSVDDPELQKLKALVDELERRNNIQ
jgi:hypothetical protein